MGEGIHGFEERPGEGTGGPVRGGEPSGTPDRDEPGLRGPAELEALLRDLDGRGYKAYKALAGLWAMPGFVLCFDHVQGDPFATPSRVTVRLTPEEADLPPAAYRSPARATGVACLLAHAFAGMARTMSRSRGTGRSGEIRMMHPGQLVLPTTALRISPGGAVEARCAVGLPANGRRIAGRHARALLLEDVPAVVDATLRGPRYADEELERHAANAEDADALRRALRERRLVAFVADGARLPRRSGVDDRPLEGPHVVPFRSPDSIRVSVNLPNEGDCSGMGVPEGITLVVGGGFHGKSTLLRALQDGVYDHAPDDGRERVVTRDDAVKIRAEDGRAVTGVDISGFISGIPLGRDTRAFRTPNASGSTSQAAAIVEALEAGSRLLLVDEDTSATNFMIRDRRMQALVPAEGEPITPFVDRAHELHREHGVSTVLVVGGSGDYLDVADTVVRMADYLPHDVTAEARRVAEALPTQRSSEAKHPLVLPPARTLDPDSLDPSRGRRSRHVKVPDDRTLLFGTETIDLAAVEQLVLRGQMRTVGEVLAWIASVPDGGGSDSIPDILDAAETALRETGPDAFTSLRPGDLAAVRRFEIAAALNRLRCLRVE
jgi:predicted ABC-class ATPase